MNITVEKKACAATINIEIPADKVTAERQSILKAYLNQAKIPGFRPGKAPLAMIEKRYNSEITEELTTRLIRQGCDTAIDQEKLNAINVQIDGEPSFNEAGSFSFTSSVALAPEFVLPTYKGLEIEEPSSEVTEEDIDNTIQDLRQRFADFKNVERTIEDGDFAIVDFTATTGGKPVAEAIGKSAGFLEGRENHWVKIEEDSFLPGFALQLKGLNIGDKKDVSVTIAEDFPISELRGKEVAFAVTVKEAKVQDLPEFNDEFAAKLLPGKNADELKNVIREQIQNDKEKASADAKVNQIIEKLTSAVDFDLPEFLVEAEAQQNAQQMAQRGMRQGMTQEMLAAQKQEILDTATEQARVNLKTNFILQEIAKEEKIQIQDQDVLGRIYQLAQQAGKAPKKYIKELQKAGAIQNVRHSVLIGKTIDFLVENAKVSSTSVTATEESNA